MGDEGLALLGVVIEERGVDQTIRKLNQLAESGANAERATAGLTLAQADLLARSQQLVQAAGAVDVKSAAATAQIANQASEVRALSAMMGGLAAADKNVAAAIETLNARTREASAAMASVQGAQAPAAAGAANVAKQTAALGAATGLTSSGLNSMRASLTSMAAAALGTAPGVAQLTGVLGTMALGSGVMVGVLAGVAALTAAYEHFTQKSRAAKEAADAFEKSNAGLTANRRADLIERSVSGNRQGVQIEIAAPTKELQAAADALRGIHNELNSDFFSRLDRVRFTHLGEFQQLNDQLIALRRALSDGRITVDQFEHGLSALDRAMPGFEKEIDETRRLGERLEEAAKAANRLAAETNNAAAEARALIAVHGQPGTSFEQGGEAAVRLAEQRRALAEAQQRAGAAQSGGALGVQAIETQRQALEEATASWKDYVVATGNAVLANTSYAQALSQHNAVAVEFLRNAHAQIAANQQVTRTLAVQAEVTRGTGELEKIRALNGAYRESELAQRVLGIQLDATNQKRQNALQYQGAELAGLNALADGTARARIQQVQLNDQLDRENKLRQSRNQNAGALEAALHSRNRAGLSSSDAEVQAALDRAQEEIDAENRRFAALTGLTAAQRQTEATIHRERLDNIRAESAADLERITRAREAATQQAVTTTVRDSDAETAGIRAMMQAEMEGSRAVEQMRVQLAGEDAVRRALNDAIARGTTLTQEQADAIGRSAEELERTRINAEKLRNVFREVSGAANQFLTDAFNKRNPFPALGERLKARIIGAVSDALARPITVRIGKILGIEIPEDKQVRAGNLMKEAAATQLRAAEIMTGRAPSGGAGVPGPATPTSTSIELFRKAMGIGGAAIGGYGTGYGIGQGTGSGVLGAVGGALAGAKLGSAFGPVGTAAGAIAGAIGGFIGAADAAREAAKRLEEARKAFKLALDDFAATVNHDDLGRAIAQAQSQADALRKQFHDTLTIWSLLDHGRRGDTLGTYQKISDLEAQYIAQLKEEAAVKGERRIEDYQQRLDEATPGNDRAEAIAAYNRQKDRELEDLRRSFGPVIDAQEAATYAVAQQAIAAEKAKFATEQNTQAVNAFTTSVRGLPTGYKVEPYIYEFAKAAPRPGQWQVPQNPFVPPMSPLNPPTLSRGVSTGAASAAAVTFDLRGAVFQFPDVTDGDEAAKQFLRRLDQTKENVLGGRGTRAAALEVMPS